MIRMDEYVYQITHTNNTLTMHIRTETQEKSGKNFKKL